MLSMREQIAIGTTVTAELASAIAPSGECSREGESGTWMPTACEGCTCFCPLEVYVENGRAVRVRGNRNCTATHGKCCPKASFAIQQAYDPDRIKSPMKRTNPRKGRGIDPGFIPIGWDEALDAIADKLLELRANGEPHKFMFVKGRSSQVGDILYRFFPILMGTPNYFGHSTICAETERAASWAVNGLYAYRDYDLANCKCFLLWSADPISSNRQQPAFTARLSEILEKSYLVAIDPRLSVTAAKADKWLPIIPGTDGALACAIAHVILTEGAWNKEFVGDFRESLESGGPAGLRDGCVSRFSPGVKVDEGGFESAQSHGLVKWWNEVLKDATPEWAAKICGIDAQDIVEVAREFAKGGTAVCSWVAPGTSNQPNGIYGAMAAEALNGLAGSFQSKGGPRRGVDVDVSPWPDHRPYCDEVAKKFEQEPKCDHRDRIEWPAIRSGRHSAQVLTNNLAEVILNDDPYDIKFLMSSYCNYAFSCTGSQRWEAALAKVPFHVCITMNPSESAQFADIVLPAKHHTLEQYGYVKAFQDTVGYAAIEQPVIEPVGDAKADETELAWAIAERLKDKGFDAVFRFFSQAFADPETGDLPYDEASFMEIVTKMRMFPMWGGKGGWREFCSKGVFESSSAAAKQGWGQFATKTGRYEFYSETLKEQLEAKARAHSKDVDFCMQNYWGYEARGDLCYLPHFETPARFGDPSEYPYVFSEHRSRMSCEGRSANLPLFQELKGLDPGDEAWDDVLKINPADMKVLGLKDGDVIEVESVQGKIAVKAKGWEGTRPGVVVKCYGQGHWAYGHVAAVDFAKAIPRGGNNNEILPVAYDRISGNTARHGGFARVKITLA